MGMPYFRRFAVVEDFHHRRQLELTYNLTGALLISGFWLGFAATVGLYWVPDLGPYLQVPAAFVGVLNSIILYKLSSHVIVQTSTSKPLNVTQLGLALVSLALATAGSITHALFLTSGNDYRSCLLRGGMPGPVPPEMFLCSPDTIGDSVTLGISAINLGIFAFVQYICFRTQCKRVWEKCLEVSGVESEADMAAHGPLTRKEPANTSVLRNSTVQRNGSAAHHPHQPLIELENLAPPSYEQSMA
jgi:hypothetical protein